MCSWLLHLGLGEYPSELENSRRSPALQSLLQRSVSLYAADTLSHLEAKLRSPSGAAHNQLVACSVLLR